MCQLPSTFRADGRPYYNFNQPSIRLGDLSTSINFLVRPADLPSTSVNFLCSQKTFCQLSVQLEDFPSNSFNFICHRRPSVNFLCRWETFRQLSSNLLAAGTPFGNFGQLFVWPGDLGQLQSTFHAARRPSINFRQLSMRMGDLHLTSVIVPCSLESFC